MFCKSGKVKRRVAGVRVKVSECDRGKGRLLGPSSKRKVEFTLGKRKLAELSEQSKSGTGVKSKS